MAKSMARYRGSDGDYPNVEYPYAELEWHLVLSAMTNIANWLYLAGSLCFLLGTLSNLGVFR